MSRYSNVGYNQKTMVERLLLLVYSSRSSRSTPIGNLTNIDNNGYVQQTKQISERSVTFYYEYYD